MKRGVSISLFLLLAFSVFNSGDFGQSSNPPPPDPPKKAFAVDDYSQASIVLDGTLVLNNLDASADSKIGFVRNLARSLLQTERVSIVYRMEACDIGKLSDGDTALGQVLYRKLAFDSVTEGFFDNVKDFLVTGGKRYFRIVLDTPEGKASSDAIPSPAREP